VTPEVQALVEETLALAIARESLRHPRHSGVLIPLRARFARLLIKRWRKQQRLFLREASHWLGKLGAGHREADADLKAKLQASVTAKINAGSALSQPPTRDETNAYDSMVEAAASGAIDNISVDLAIEAAADAGKTFATNYLKKNSFHQLASDIDATTRDRMANAVADSFASGGSYDDAVKAIKGAFKAMTDKRADTIAQTELADVYNQAMLASARETEGELLKVWNPDGEACAEICQPNVDQSAIGLDEDFESGDDAPPGHPNCDCSIGFVRSSEA